MTKINPNILQWLLQNTNSQNLYNALKNLDELHHLMQQGGFKINANAFDNAIVQQRLLNLLSQQDFLVQPFLCELSRRRPWRNVCLASQMLDEKYLLKNWRKIIESLADPRMLIMGLYMDNKSEALYRLSERLMSCPSLWQKQNSSKPADKDLAEALSCFASEPGLAKPAPGIEPKQLKAEQNKNAELRKQLKSYKNELEQMQRQKQQAQDTMALMSQQQEEELINQEKLWQKECEEQVQKAQSEAEEIHRAVMQQLLGYKPGEENNLRQDTEMAVSLSRRIDKALQRQAEINTRFGMRHELLQKLHQLQAQQEQLRMAINDAIVLDDELYELDKECNAKLYELRKTLNEEPEALSLDSIPFRIENMIKTVRLDNRDATEKLLEIKEFLSQKQWQQLLTAAEQEKLNDILEKQSKTHGHILTQTKDKNNIDTPQCNEIWSIAQHVADFKRINIYVDACNLMLCAPEWQERIKAKGQAETRKLLVEKCKSKVNLFRQISLVFDSVEEMDSIENIGNNLSLHFAGKKQEEQNADNYLVDMLQKKISDPKQISWIVTDDYGLRNRVHSLCNGAVPVQEFARFLKM